MPIERCSGGSVSPGRGDHLRDHDLSFADRFEAGDGAQCGRLAAPLGPSRLTISPRLTWNDSDAITRSPAVTCVMFSTLSRGIWDQADMRCWRADCSSAQQEFEQGL